MFRILMDKTPIESAFNYIGLSMYILYVNLPSQPLPTLNLSKLK